MLSFFNLMHAFDLNFLFLVKLRQREAEAEAEANEHVTWDKDVVDNEHMNKKSSKKCCIFHKARSFGESDSDESDRYDDGNFPFEHVSFSYFPTFLFYLFIYSFYVFKSITSLATGKVLTKVKRTTREHRELSVNLGSYFR
jgi:hypothetical protein